MCKPYKQGVTLPENSAQGSEVYSDVASGIQGGARQFTEFKCAVYHL
ncbi:hypothetical protein ANAPRD1_00969 [Anaplasma phagocytophilum]|nr:hypothetical protein ANAPH2_00840 [Anaplasma phagocytophilum]SCV65988.1 hypothetical protein ANAPRD1_00969 [Anaplasma phagocytophilum]